MRLQVQHIYGGSTSALASFKNAFTAEGSFTSHSLSFSLSLSLSLALALFSFFDLVLTSSTGVQGLYRGATPPMVAEALINSFLFGFLSFPFFPFFKTFFNLSFFLRNLCGGFKLPLKGYVFLIFIFCFVFSEYKQEYRS